ncbi:MAG: reprolysin-like metallopeptidase [Ferruginibacter sp.]
MKKIYLSLALFMLAMTSLNQLSQAQQSFFRDIKSSDIQNNTLTRAIVPNEFRLVRADLASLKSFLWALPKEQTILFNRNSAPILSLPLPDGRTGRFRVWESSIQEAGLEAQFPDIRTFNGQGIDDPRATIRFDLTLRGFHAQVLTPENTWYMDPYAIGNTEDYISYFRRHNHRPSFFHCDVNEESLAARPTNVQAPCRGTNLKTYRLAVACTGEYAQAPGIAAGTNAAILHSAIVTTVNRVVGVYEVELAIRLVLVANNNLIEYLQASTDPFNGNNNANTLITESQTVITNNIGSGNFDIGHTFSTGGGGLAGLGVVCNNGSKARGITGSPNPTGDGYDIDYVAHEMGHQFGGNHPMNGCGSSPITTSYEPGSGTTIMAYAGICGTQDIQPNSDPTFHAISFDEISNFLVAGGASCGVSTPTGNTLPVIDPLPFTSLSIPPNTPFILTGSATDANGDALSYCWEQWDLGNPGASWNIGLTAGAGNTAPLFKSRLPKTTGSRTFPDIAVILANYPTNPAATMGGLKGEILSPVERAMKFKLTVRDNRAAGGGVVSAGSGGCQTASTLQLNVVGTTPFTVTAPNGGETWGGGTSQTINWNVSGTSSAPISTATVKITLSTDGGQTYPITILASTANDGTETISVPNNATTQARIRVEAINNVFFDISNANFTITAAVAGFAFDNPATTNTACGSAASASVSLSTISLAGFATPINLSASGNPAGTTVTFSSNPVTPGNSTTVTLSGVNTLTPGNYTITVTGVAGSSTQTRNLTFSVTPSTPPSITTQPSDISICSGNNATFTSASSATGVTYQWQVSTDGGTTYTNISGANNPSYTVTGTTTVQNNYKYRVLIATQCASVTSNAATLSVTVAASFSAQPNNVTVCSGSNVNFSATAAGTNLTYQWQISNDGGTTFTNIAGATSSSLSLNNVSVALNNNRYRLVITVTGGACPGSLNSNIATLVVNTLPTVTANSSASSVCTGTAVTLTAGGANTYSWAPGNQIGSSITITPTVNPTNPGAPVVNTYTVTGSTTAGCTGTATVNVTTNPQPTVTLTANPAVTALFPGLSTTLTAQVTPTSTSTVYQWYQNGAAISGATTSSYNVSIDQLGTYSVTVSIGNCNATSSNLTITDSLNTSLFIFPNPNRGLFQVRYNDKLNGVSNPRTLTIYDSKGARVYKQVFNVNTPFGRMDVDLRHVASGIYFVELTDAAGERLKAGKVIISQ